jgi:ribosomal protein S1
LGLRPLNPGLAGEPLDQTDDEALQGAMFFPRITEMDGRGGLFVEVVGGVEGFKHRSFASC